MPNGGILGPVNTPSTTSSKGIWRLEEEYAAVKLGTWPAGSLPVTANLLSWYDVADASSVTVSGGKISSLLDKSGNGRHATQANAAQQPLYLANTQNGLPVMEFVSTSSTFLSIANPITHSSRNTHIFAVVKSKNVSANETTGFYGSQGITYSLAYCLPGQTAARQTLLHPGIAWMGASSVATFNTSRFYNINASWNGSTIAYRQSKTDDGTATYTGTPSNPSNAIGCQEVSSYSGTYVAELIIYSAPLSASDRNLVENYLFAKWGV